MFINISIKFRFVTIGVLLISWSLLVAADVDALMSAEKKRGSQNITISPDRYEKITYETYEKEEELPPQEEVLEPMSEEENVTMETIIAEEIKRTKEEKRRIIEEEKEEFPTFPDETRPFVVKETVEPRLSEPKAEGVEPLERHNIIISERPFLLGLILLALSVIVFYIYKFTIKKLNK